jgi:hypothetical protein
VSDTSTERSLSYESNDSATTSQSNRRVSTGMITMVDEVGTLRAEASLQSVDSTNFTLNWTTNNTSAYIFHFIAIGGTHVQAKVVGWTMATADGDQSITGVGFKPDVVIHAHVGAGHTSAPSSTSQHGSFGLGAMDAQGGQWAWAVFSTDGSNFTDTSRYQRADECLVAVGGSQSEVKDATFVSMDTDGFTINYSQSVTGVRFRPRVVLLTSVQDTTRTVSVSHTRFGLGASNTSTEGAIAIQDADGQDTSSVDGVDSTTKAYVKVNNDSQSTDAAADLASLDEDGFTLSWTTNDAVATEMLYLALSTRRRLVVVSEAPRASAIR